MHLTMKQLVCLAILAMVIQPSQQKELCFSISSGSRPAAQHSRNPLHVCYFAETVGLFSLSSSSPRPFTIRHTTSLSPLRMNLFNGLARSLQESVAEATKSATVQHILVQTENEALDIRKKIANDGLESFGKYAQQFSKCGSAKKRPDAKLAQLVGLPGEMSFRKGQTDKEFEKVCFQSPIGVVHGPVETQFESAAVAEDDKTLGVGDARGQLESKSASKNKSKALAKAQGKKKK